MKIAIHQPNFLPWSGYFYKMANADMFVFLDNVQYEKNAFCNRTKIKNPQGSQWLSLPIKTAGQYHQKISETKIQEQKNWKEKYIKTIEINYKRAKYFDYLFPELKSILQKDWESLSELNISLIELLKIKLGIKTKTEIASRYNLRTKNTELLIDVAKIFNADTYLSGKGGRQYQDEEKIKMAGIRLEYTNFISPVYPQLWGKFVADLSIIDLLFNCGSDSLKVILENNFNKKI